MASLDRNLRKGLEKAVRKARGVAEAGARQVLEQLAVNHHEPWPALTHEQRKLRTRLRAHGRQLGDRLDERKGAQAIDRLAGECAYEHWHRLLFARFLAENDLLVEPHSGMALPLDECRELARERGVDWLVLASEFAQRMLPQIFRAGDPVLEVSLPPEKRQALEAILEAQPREVFVADDSLGWVYQFWQADKKQEANDSGNKIGADELPAVTQLFTEDYMVDFLLDNTLGAWHAGKVLTANPDLAGKVQSEDELRKAVTLPGCPWRHLRFIQGKDGNWVPAAGAFAGWPKVAKELKSLDPCMGSGHFVVAMFERLVALRMAEEGLTGAAAVMAVISDNLFGLEIDPRCTQISAFNLALAAWRRAGHCPLPAMNLACSGLAPNTHEADWLAIAGDDYKLKNGMARLYRLFQRAALLGSLINPRAGEGDLLVAAFHELQPLLEEALAQETGDDAVHEMAVTARGLAKAAEILAGQFTLVATNVPFLRRGNQCENLQDYVEEVFTEGRADLGVAFLQRCLAFLSPKGTSACVSQQHFLYLGSYEDFRIDILSKSTIQFLVRLGPGAFETISGENVTVALSCLTQSAPAAGTVIHYCDAQAARTPTAKAEQIRGAELVRLNQDAQRNNPDSRIGFSHESSIPLLRTRSGALVGLQNGDTPRFIMSFWEAPRIVFPWSPFQLTCDETILYGGRRGILRWENGKGELASASYARVQGTEAWGRKGVAVRNTVPLPVTLYSGDLYDQSSTAIVPLDATDLPALWSFCSSEAFFPAVQLVDGKRNKTNQTYLKIPFDLAHWREVAAEKYPHGLPKPFSSDPTQWLFCGHPAGADRPLDVAVARLLGYEWPRQTGSSFPDCRALGPDGLETLADDDGIACLPSVCSEEPAAERLRKLLATAYGSDWSAAKLDALLGQVASAGKPLEEWIRSDFFAQHCETFHQTPFIWQIWDGLQNGFSALINYHRLAGGSGEGRRTLEKLIFTYLGDWIDRQRFGQKRGVEGADGRVAAAVHLKAELEKILEGEPPFDIFVRWKPLHQLPIGWDPDINDGVRLNIRPFMTAKLLNPRGRGSCILRVTPSIKWEKDRGKEPGCTKSDYPWFWSWDGEERNFSGGADFDGNRWNDLHYTRAVKLAARERARGGKS